MEKIQISFGEIAILSIFFFFVTSAEVCCGDGDACCDGDTQQCCENYARISCASCRPLYYTYGYCCPKGDTCCDYDEYSDGICCPTASVCCYEECCNPLFSEHCCTGRYGKGCCIGPEYCCDGTCCRVGIDECCEGACCNPSTETCCNGACCDASETCFPGVLDGDGLCCSGDLVRCGYGASAFCCEEGSIECASSNRPPVSLKYCSPNSQCCAEYTFNHDCCEANETCCGDAACVFDVGGECCGSLMCDPSEKCCGDTCYPTDAGECCGNGVCDEYCCGGTCVPSSDMCCGDVVCVDGHYCCTEGSGGPMCCPDGQDCTCNVCMDPLAEDEVCCDINGDSPICSEGSQCCARLLEDDFCCDGQCCWDGSPLCCGDGTNCVANKCCPEEKTCGNSCCELDETCKTGNCEVQPACKLHEYSLGCPKTGYSYDRISYSDHIMCCVLAAGCQCPSSVITDTCEAPAITVVESPESCDNCLDACRGYPSCCTGSGCMCEISCESYSDCPYPSTKKSDCHWSGFCAVNCINAPENKRGDCIYAVDHTGQRTVIEESDYSVNVCFYKDSDCNDPVACYAFSGDGEYDTTITEFDPRVTQHHAVLNGNYQRTVNGDVVADLQFGDCVSNLQFGNFVRLFYGSSQNSNDNDDSQANDNDNDDGDGERKNPKLGLFSSTRSIIGFVASASGVVIAIVLLLLFFCCCCLCVYRVKKKQKKGARVSDIVQEQELEVKVRRAIKISTVTVTETKDQPKKEEKEMLASSKRISRDDIAKSAESQSDCSGDEDSSSSLVLQEGESSSNCEETSTDFESD